MTLLPKPILLFGETMNYHLIKWDSSKEPDDDEVVLSGTLDDCKSAVRSLQRRLGGNFHQELDPGIGGPLRWENEKWAIYIVDDNRNSPEG